jgi:hypothetical protein
MSPGAGSTWFPLLASRASWCIESDRATGIRFREPVTEYSPCQELEAHLQTMLVGVKRLAMQYSPRNAIMYVSMVDPGTLEMLREMGKEIVSSADLVSQFEAVLTEEQIRSHFAAQEKLDRILAEGRSTWFRDRQVRDSRVAHRSPAPQGLVWERHLPNRDCLPKGLPV